MGIMLKLKAVSLINMNIQLLLRKMSKQIHVFGPVQCELRIFGLY